MPTVTLGHRPRLPHQATAWIRRSSYGTKAWLRCVRSSIVQRDTDDVFRGSAFALYDVLYKAAFVAAAALACPRSAGQRLLAGGLRRAGARLPRNRRHLPVPVAGGVLTATGTESTSLGPPRLSPEGEKPARWDQRITYPASGIGTRPERDLTLGDPPCLVFLMGDINGQKCLGEGSLTEATLMRRGDEYQDQTRLGRTGSRSRL